ncbi:hypothetical protein AB7W30_21080 [Providencia manganoxydans]|uniref:hypothetical protein n=1 Tax=Providencia manganoxydans TaxID=2923283 RepID=UPI0032DBCEFD
MPKKGDVHTGAVAWPFTREFIAFYFFIVLALFIDGIRGAYYSINYSLFADKEIKRAKGSMKNTEAIHGILFYLIWNVAISSRDKLYGKHYPVFNYLIIYLY